MPRIATVLFFLTLICARAARADVVIPAFVVEMLRQAHITARVDDLGRDAVLRQRSELTCGPAALASLLTYYFADKTSEGEIAKLAGTYERWGTTLLGLRDACRAKGYAATGYRMSLQQLAATLGEIGVPVIAHYREPVMHFVLVVAVDGDYVLVSDPASGNATLHVDDFVRRWSGAVLVVKSRAATDKARVERRRASFEQRLHTLRETNRTWWIQRP